MMPPAISFCCHAEEEGDLGRRFSRIDLHVARRPFQRDMEHVAFGEIFDPKSLMERLRGEPEHHVHLVGDKVHFSPEGDVEGVGDKDFCPLNIGNPILDAEVDRGEPELELFFPRELF